MPRPRALHVSSRNMLPRPFVQRYSEDFEEMLSNFRWRQNLTLAMLQNSLGFKREGIKVLYDKDNNPYKAIYEVGARAGRQIRDADAQYPTYTIRNWERKGVWESRKSKDPIEVPADFLLYLAEAYSPRVVQALQCDPEISDLFEVLGIYQTDEGLIVKETNEYYPLETPTVPAKSFERYQKEEELLEENPYNDSLDEFLYGNPGEEPLGEELQAGEEFGETFWGKLEQEQIPEPPADMLRTGKYRTAQVEIIDFSDEEHPKRKVLGEKSLLRIALYRLFELKPAVRERMIYLLLWMIYSAE